MTDMYRSKEFWETDPNPKHICNIPSAKWEDTYGLCNQSAEHMNNIKIGYELHMNLKYLLILHRISKLQVAFSK